MTESAVRAASPSLTAPTAADAVTAVKRQRVEDGRTSPHAMLDIVMTPITGSALPMPLSTLHSTGGSSLPASLPSSALPLPFPTAATSLSSSSNSSSTSLTSASPSTSSIDSPPRPSTALVSLVDQYAYKLHLPPAQARLALQLVSSIVAASPNCQSRLHSSTTDNQRAWAACCIWLSVLLSSLPSSVYAAVTFAPQQLVSPTLTELLLLFALPLSTFLRHAAHALSHVAPLLLPNEAAVVSERCGVWLQRWLYSCALWRKYEKMYAAAIYPHMTAVESRQAAPAAATTGVGQWRSADLYGCGWLLFQCVRGELRLNEAHPTYVLLLCVLRLMLCCVMREKGKVEHAAANGVTAASEEAMESALRGICQHDGAVDEPLQTAVRAMYATELQPLLSRLQDQGNLRFPSPSQQYELFGPSELQANITSLGHLLDSRSQVEEGAPVCFVLDERVFLMDRMTEVESGGPPAQQQQQQQADVNGPDAEVKMNGKSSAPSHRRVLFGTDTNGAASSTSPTPASSASSSSSSASPSPSLPDRSPLSSSTPPFSTPHKLTTLHHAFSPSLRLPHVPSISHPGSRTPISRMLESVSFLHATFSPLPPSPSPALHAYFASKQAGGLEALVKLINGVVGKVRISDAGGGGAGGASEAKRELAAKIYWSVIDALVASASSASAASTTPSWLLSRSFHCALLCVCFELVFSAYKHTLLAFPHSMHLFDIKYFDLLKVVDTALRYLPPLPAALKAHIGGMEVSMCERRCWTYGEKAVEMMADERVRAKVEETMRNAIHNQSTASATTDAHKRAGSKEMKDDAPTSPSSNTNATTPSSSSSCYHFLPLPPSVPI